MTRVRIVLLTALLTLAPLCGGAIAGGASGGDGSGPRATVQATTSAVVSVLANKSLSADQKRHQIEDIVYARVDFETLSRLVLARNWSQLSEAQQKQFMEEFRQNLSAAGCIVAS